MDSIMRLCPRCRMVFYAGTMTWQTRCPHCALDIGTWIERRSASRQPGRHPVTIQCRNTRCSGYTLDHSKMGLKIAYRGNPFSLHERISVDVEALDINGPAEVLWIQTSDDDLTQAGITMLRDMCRADHHQ